MAAIDIRHPHSLPLPKARKAVQQVAEKLSERFGVTYAWNGDTLNFSRSGVDGHIALEPSQLHVSAKLGFLFSAMQGPIEAEIRKVLGDKFA